MWGFKDSYQNAALLFIFNWRKKMFLPYPKIHFFFPSGGSTKHCTHLLLVRSFCHNLNPRWPIGWEICPSVHSAHNTFNNGSRQKGHNGNIHSNLLIIVFQNEVVVVVVVFVLVVVVVILGQLLPGLSKNTVCWRSAGRTSRVAAGSCCSRSNT